MLASHRVVLADIGAAGEPDPRWNAVRDYTRWISFEPRTENTPCPAHAPDTRYDVCLGESKGTRVLHETRFADASSLYDIDRESMNVFAVHECFEPLGSREVQVRTLDDCVGEHPDLSPAFLKVDVEGAELDVFRGGVQTISRSVLGIRTEISFRQRHMGGPLFGDVDDHLRSAGFELFGLTREHMIRANRLHNPLSQPQLVWGDALYCLSRRTFLERMATLSASRRTIQLVHFLVILLAHRIHDYSLELVDACAREWRLDEALAEDFRQTIRTSARLGPLFHAKAVAGMILAAVIAIGSLPFPQARRQARFYWKRRAGLLFFHLWRRTARSGELNASVSDTLP